MTQNSLRRPDYPIHSLFLDRWSSRAISEENVTMEELYSLFEAARWAPSSMNNQLTRFMYAKRGTSRWNDFYELLSEKNKSWYLKAPILVIIISRKESYYQHRSQRTHSFEAGAAFENLALEAAHRNIIAHPMGGFDYERAHQLLNLSDIWDVECMVAIGKPGQKEHLPSDLQEREMPSTRKALSELVFEGDFTE